MRFRMKCKDGVWTKVAVRRKNVPFFMVDHPEAIEIGELHPRYVAQV